MKTLITYAPSHLTTNPKLRHALVLDWRKIPRILAGHYPKPLPPRKWYTNDAADQAWVSGAWSRVGMANGAPVSVRALAYIMVGHARHHMGVLRERYQIGGAN